MELRTLTPEEWPLVEQIVKGEFNNDMPVTPTQSTFLTAFDGEKLAATLHVDVVFFPHAIKVMPEYRGTRLAWRLMVEAARRVPAGFSMIVLAQPDSTTAKLLERLGGRNIGTYQVWRKDY